MRADAASYEAALRASDLAFRRLHGARAPLRALSAEEAEHAELEDDGDEDEAEERTVFLTVARSARRGAS